MFIGAAEADVRKWLHARADAFEGRTLFVGCSGNFTIEKLLGAKAAAVHSNDVCAYSHFLGNYLAGQQITCAIREGLWEWLRPFLETNFGATIVLLSELLKFDPEKSIYGKRMYGAIADNWEYYFEKTVERVDAAKAEAHITTYRSSDIFTFVEEARRIDPEGIFLAVLPSGRGPMDKICKKINEILAWDPPPFEVLKPESKTDLVALIQRFEHVIVDDTEHPHAVMLKQKMGKQLWLHSNLGGQPVLIQSHVKERPTYYPALVESDLRKITAKSQIVIKRVKSDEINYYRNRYLAKTITFVNGMWNFLFFIDGKLFGFAILNLDKYAGKGLYLISDFALPVEGARLSKLVLWLLQSTHFLNVMEELVLAKVPDLTTTAFTERPASMKYRGVFELTKRGESNGKKFLNYQSKTGLHTDREAIMKWMALHRTQAQQAHKNPSREKLEN